ncbi:M36 family metallopeptidase [Flavobacteriaceae bacterium TK19130]|nr:M36 family metallopeptidase [Thermobacterium salinum]
MKKNTLWILTGLLLISSISLKAQDNRKALTAQFDALLENNELNRSDLEYQITSSHISSASGIEHTYFKQAINGIPVVGTESSIHATADGRTISASNKFIKNSNQRVTTNAASLTAAQAAQSAAAQLGYNISEDFTVLERTNEGNVVLSDGGISLSAIPAKLVYQRNANEELVLSWDISIQATDQHDWWNVRVDATSGIIIDQANWIVSCSFDHDHVSEEKLDYNKNLFDIPNYEELVETSGCTECYEVIAIPFESPYFTTRTIETLPADVSSSPFGWHDTNGSAGAEFTTTRGNNVNAYEDGDNPGYQPDGGSNLDFTGYPFDQNYSFSNQYEDAAITNLFYWNNIIHDVMHQYGFDEASGNFQENNYGNGGNASDSVNAEAQDASGTCNANFGTPPDGSNPQMQMYTCSDKDGDFDNLVIVHEYGHGISNRLTGGALEAGCLQNTEQMGEGWSDWYGTMMTIQPGDTGTDARPVGTYLFDQGPGGNGIRDFPYTTDMGVNPQTYDFIQSASVPHGVGSVWASMLWEVTWALIDEHGFDEDIYNFTGDVNQDAGNIMAMAIVTEGMKLQPCSPGFVDGRDAIIAADEVLYGGANQCLLWEAFAKRGLGYSANQGSSFSRSDGTEAFDLPPSEAEFSAPADVCASSDVLTELGGGLPIGGVYSGPGVTDDGNGLTYTFDPSAAGVGVQDITYTVPESLCTTASSDTDSIEVLAVPDSPATVGVPDYCPGDEVTVTATPVDSNNIIGWYDAEFGGTLLAEGESYTFTPTASTTVYAQENPDVELSKLVISEVTLETPDRLEIQNVGLAKDYSGYTVIASDEPYSNINSVNSSTQELGFMEANSVVTYNDSGGAGYWGDNLWWDNDGTGWIIVIDTEGNVVDSVFWNFSETEINQLDITVNGFTITAADLDWTGAGANLLANCDNSFRRVGDTDTSSDWSNTCLPSDFGVANDDIDVTAYQGCLASRTATPVTVETVLPELTCPDNDTVIVDGGEVYTLTDYTTQATATDNCTAEPTITQDPVAGTELPLGENTITVTAIDEAGNVATCTFVITVQDELDIADVSMEEAIELYPNPTSGTLTILNRSNEKLLKATVIDVKGRVIQTVDLREMATESTIAMDAFANGMYFVQISSENRQMVKRIIKK